MTPSRDFNGSLSLSYNVIDNHGGVLAATQSLMISAMNDAPTGAASAVLAAGVEDTAYIVTTNLLLGFSDVDSGDTLTISGLTTAQGTIVANADHTYTITPNANYRGAVVLHYTVNDGHGGSIAATQNVHLAATNDAPTGVPTALLASAIENRAYEFTASQLLLGFSDPDSETINVINVTSNLGSVQQQTNGRYTLTPPNDYNGIIQINYTVTDGHGGSVAATQQVNVMVVTQQLMATEGADTLRGGGGNDTYIVNHINDVVVELNNASIDTAWKLDQGDFARSDISIAKIHAADTLHKAADTAIQLLGARGYSKDTIVEWIYRYARQARLVDGASEIHKMVLSRAYLSEGQDFFRWGV